MWYPSSKEELEKIIDGFFVNAEKKAKAEGFKSDFKSIKGVIVPHAGYAYSGQIAAYAYWILKKNLKDISKKIAIVFGPSHYFYFHGLLGHNQGYWETPLGKLEVKNLAGIKTANIKQEHSIDNQIPFLQRIGIKKVMPICVGEISLDEAKAIAQKIRKLLANAVLVFSTDLSHFYSQEIAKSIDKKSIEAIEKVEIERARSIEACGIYPLLILLWLCKLKGLRPMLIEYKTSGDVTGQLNSVVGYAAFAICKA
jgi:AmmeMemoRadiSam system protein B